MNTSLRSGRPERKPGVWVRRAGDEIVVYDPTTEDINVLNSSALAIWELCDGKTLPEEMVAAVVDLSGLHPDIISEDVERILTEFDKKGLLEWKP